jgi:hypothetical protein
VSIYLFLFLFYLFAILVWCNFKIHVYLLLNALHIQLVKN